MTTITLPSPAGDRGRRLASERLDAALLLCRDYLGREPTITDDGTTRSLVFIPDLTPAEATTLAFIVKISGFGVITPTEMGAVEASVTTVKAYLNITSPTNAQTANALKALVRIVGVILRD